MIKILGRNIARFVFLVLLQVLVLDHVHLWGFVNPYIFILFIILLPFETPGWLLLFFGFFLGLSIDIFNDTPGIHTSATVFMCFIRPAMLKLIAPREGYEPGTYPRLYYYGFNWFMKYSIIMVLVHHSVYFFLEASGFDNLLNTLIKILASGIFSLILIVLSQFLMYRKG
ncbi:MAG: rod shape-determining protein MreD [Bacteroidetes bacterium]|nr:rod shape-determining protein MreD [Bacteroidota bacterium]